MLSLTDSHAHLLSEPLNIHVEEVLSRAKSAGISTIINICIDSQQIKDALELVKKHPWVFNAAAVHPHDAEKDGEALFPEVVLHAKQGHLIAIGETGLDYHYNHSSPDIQREFLRKHLQLALEYQLPVIIHCREAFADFFQIIDADYGRGRGVLHCFTGSVEEAEQVLERGWYLSLSGIVTFKKSSVLREVARLVPLDKLLIETDAPFLAPQSHRGKPNEPAFILETAMVIAAVKGITVTELAQATSANAKKLFALP